MTKTTTPLAMKVAGKHVVVDTSSLLTEGITLLREIADCHVVIPAVVVSELEGLRTGGSTTAFFARQWLQLLESLRAEYGAQLRNSVPLGVRAGSGVTLSVEPNHSTQSTLPRHLQDKSNDSTVLAVANNLKQDGDDVVLLSNDTPMRIHSTLDIGIDSFEYTASSASESTTVFSGRIELVVSNAEAEEYRLYDVSTIDEAAGEFLLDRLDEMGSVPTHALVEVRLEDGSRVSEILVDGVGEARALNPRPRAQRAGEVTSRSQEQAVAMRLLSKPSEDLPVVSLSGRAGAGKTLITLAVAMDEVKRSRYQKVLVFRSLHEMGAGQEMGFLPGDVDEKMGPWAGAITDALEAIASSKLKKSEAAHAKTKVDAEVKRMQEMIEVLPITYLRGRSLSNAFIIIEEAQNFSRSELLHILSRTGNGSKVVLTFDADQVDNRFLRPGKHADIWSVVSALKDTDVLGHFTLQKTERSRVAQVTSELLMDINSAIPEKDA